MKRSRLVWFLSVPVVLVLVAAYVWVTGGRYVTTENAYVKRDKVSVSSDVTGRIVAVEVRENEMVEAGQVLFRIEDSDFRIRLAQIEAELAAARLDVERLRADYRQRLADVRAARDNLAYQKREFERRRKLRESGFAAEADYDRARLAMEAAEQKLATEEQAARSILAELGGNPDIRVDEHPKVMQVAARKAQAELDLKRTVVRAPIAGVVSQSSRLLPGQYMVAGAPALSLVQSDTVWVEANFKETDLEHMSVGQKAEIVFDAVPGRKVKAEVGSIGAATGAEFAILPPQNASGNWVKVVQRVPVRLRILDEDAHTFLPAGLSAHVTVDTEYQRFLAKPVDRARVKQVAAK